MIKTQDLVTSIDLPALSLFKEGKVRSVYDLGDTLLLVASDRISAFDYILPTGIPQKGAVLTQLSAFWFEYLADHVETHLISADSQDMPAVVQPYRDQLAGRSLWVKKTELIPIECVVRGYIIGSGWKSYQETGEICGIPLPAGLQLADQLEKPIFTPAYKAEQGGHDENISLTQMSDIIGQELTLKLKELSLALYQRGQNYAQQKGLILADTKFEFGLLNGQIVLIDEVFTPDSSRYWSQGTYSPGVSPPSYDKQILRDYLELNWDKQAPVPVLPAEIVSQVSQQYQVLYRTLTAS